MVGRRVRGIADRRRVAQVAEQRGAQRGDDGPRDLVLDRRARPGARGRSARTRGCVRRATPMSCAVIRSRLPARRTVPSSTADTLSRAPRFRTSSRSPLSANTEVRDATWRPSTLPSAMISSSVMPSLRYSFSGSALAFTNGQHRDGAGLARRCPAPRRGMISGTGATSASANSVIVGKRSAGSLASARASARSMAAGTLGRRAPIGAGASIAWRAMVARGAGAGERRLAGQHLVQHAGQAVLVAAAVEPGLRARLLGAHVGRRADGEAVVGDVHGSPRRRPRPRWRRRSRR